MSVMCERLQSLGIVIMGELGKKDVSTLLVYMKETKDPPSCSLR